jgi:signal transduction histidine kinase
MKLSTKTNLNFLSISLFTFLMGIIAFYFLLRQQVDHYINTELFKARITYIQDAENMGSKQSTYLGACKLMKIKPIQQITDSLSHFKDTLIFDPAQDKYTAYRQMTFESRTTIGPQKVKIIRPLEATDNLIINVFLIMTLLVILLIITLLFINNYSSYQIWKDFYLSLEKINSFNLNNQGALDLPPTEVKEFEDLNTVLSRMSKRIANDFSRMKEYTENASHEIQTPLAIITTKLEQLIQCDKLPEKQVHIIGDAYDAANRLSRLNKTLILLARIENRQFPEVEKVFPQEIIQKHLDNYEEIIQTKKLKLSVDLSPKTSLEINPYLSDILFLNLIKNAIRHNTVGGILNLKLKSDSFEITNSGAPLEFDPDKLFNRFYKVTSSKKSLGLGLAIVKTITDIFNITISYSYHDNQHRIRLQLPKTTELES